MSGSEFTRVVGRPAQDGGAATVDTNEWFWTKTVIVRSAWYIAGALVALFFALPMLWLVTAPFEGHPGFNVGLSHVTLSNFGDVFRNPNALSSLYNSLILALLTMLIVVDRKSVV